MQITVPGNREPSSLSSNYTSVRIFSHTIKPITAVVSGESGHNYMIYIMVFTALLVAVLTSTDIDFSFMRNTIKKLGYWLRKIYLIVSR